MKIKKLNKIAVMACYQTMTPKRSETSCLLEAKALAAENKLRIDHLSYRKPDGSYGWKYGVFRLNMGLIGYRQTAAGLCSMLRKITQSRSSEPYRKNPTESAMFRSAKKLGADFHGSSPQHAVTVDYPDNPKIALAIGDLIGLAYRTRRDGKTENYFHRFKQHARPSLAVSPDGRTLYILGGEYRFTDRGIIDTVDHFKG